MPFTLPPLPYPYNALEPHIDAKTMEIHHTKHHQAYINNANAALEKHPQLANQSAEQLLRNINTVPDDVRQVLINNAGGHANHSLFWQIMGPSTGGPEKGGKPSGDLAQAIDSTFGGFEAFKQQLSDAGTKRFGSGWAWLSVKGGKLVVHATPNQDSPLMDGAAPILGVDVWEHAYYLNYQNRRPDYITAWWNTVNWDRVAEFYATARK